MTTRVGSGLRSAGLVFLGFALSVLAHTPAATRVEQTALPPVVAELATLSVGLGYVAAFVVPVALIWRRSRPLPVLLVALAASVLTPVGPAVAGLALVEVVRTGPVRVLARMVPAYLAVALGWVGLDLLGPTPATSAIKALAAPTGTPASVAYPVSVSQVVTMLLLVALPLAVGAYLRGRRDLESSREQVREEQLERGELSAQVGRQAERELIAREVHDVIGHRLSLLSLHAGGLEVAAGDDPRLRQSAALVRGEAQQTMDDLRSLLDVLRDGAAHGEADAIPADHTLADLAAVIDDVADAGSPVLSTVYLQDAERADATLSRAVYRIVQELLTNARRHAPQAPVRLVVNGRPGEGIRVETVNRLVTAPGPPGNGLSGVRERVGLLGGSVHCGPDGQGAFRVSVWLPWEDGDE